MLFNETRLCGGVKPLPQSLVLFYATIPFNEKSEVCPFFGQVCASFNYSQEAQTVRFISLIVWAFPFVSTISLHNISMAVFQNRMRYWYIRADYLPDICSNSSHNSNG